MPPFVQTLVKTVDQRFLGGLVKIDHDVSAENDVESIIMGRRIHQVESRELNQIPDVFFDTELTVIGSETHLKIFLQKRGRYIVQSLFAKYPFIGSPQYLGGNVSRCDFDVPRQTV